MAGARPAALGRGPGPGSTVGSRQGAGDEPEPYRPIAGGFEVTITPSDGRFELGLGLGRPGAEADHRRLGVPFDPVGVRGRRLVEAVDIIQRLFAGEAVTAAGRHHAIREAQLFPTPVQRPRPPILMPPPARGGCGAARPADVVAVGLP